MWWITCPSRSSTTFSRASCTSTPRASGHTAFCSTLPSSSANTGPSSLSGPLFLSRLSVSPPPHLDCSPPSLTRPSTVWGTCREPRHPLFRSHLWTNFPLVSGLGVGEGVGVGIGGSAIFGDVRASISQHALGRRLWRPSSQHALGRWLWLLPSQHALYHKGLFFFFSFLLFLFILFFVCLFCFYLFFIVVIHSS